MWVIYIVIRIPFDKKYKNSTKIVNRKTGVEKVLLIILFLGMIFIPFIWNVSPLFNDFTIELPDWLRIAGIAVSIISLFYFRWIHKTLNTNWSPTLEILEDHQLVKSGPYKRIRHPMYSQIWLWTIGQILIISNWIAGFSGIIAWAILYINRVPKEERMMIDHFGIEYIKYKEKTGRVLPRFFKGELQIKNEIIM